MSDEPGEHHPRYGAVEEYAGGEIKAYHGIVNKWLLVVYAILAVFGVYYLFKYCGLGPGLARAVGRFHDRRAHRPPAGR
jgi:hypothetical protein